MRGFTLAEMLVVIALLVIIAVVTFAAFSRFNSTLTVEQAASTVKTVFEEARSKTLSSEKDTSYGVHVQSDRVVLFVGTSYASSTPSNVDHVLPGRTYISDIALTSGANNIVFAKLTGKASATGTITIAADNATSTRIITIYETGIINAQ